MKIARVAGFGFLLSAILLVGCGILSTLQIIVDTTAAAIPVLQAAGVPIPPEVPLYIVAVADCIGEADMANPTTGRLVTIASCLAQQVEPLPAGIPEAIANLMAQIASAVANFIAQNKTAQISGVKIRPMTPSETTRFHALCTEARATAGAARGFVTH